MKILMLTPYLPYPLDMGGKTRSYNLIKDLASKHDITLFSFIRKDEEKKYIPELLKYCKKVEVFKRRKAWSITNVLLSGFTPYPFLVCLYLSLKWRKAIEDELKHGNYDLIHAETFYVCPMIPKSRVPILLVEQTIEYLVYQHFLDSTKWLFLKPLLAIDVFKLKHWEKHFWKKANRVGVMSEDDKKLVKELIPDLSVDIIPNGVDSEYFAQKQKNNSLNPTFLYVGNFNWLQNKEAALVLLKEVWPKIKKQIAKAKLWIVGRNPSSDIKAYENEDIKVDGTVEDIRDAYINSDALVAPILGGGGTRYKILEAMASGLSVVTTSIGIGGIEAVNNKNCIIEDDMEKMADAVVNLINNPEKKELIAKNAKELVDTKYNWEAIADKLDGIYREVGKK